MKRISSFQDCDRGWQRPGNEGIQVKWQTGGPTNEWKTLLKRENKDNIDMRGEEGWN